MATYVAVFALVLAYVALVAAYCALRTLAKLRRATSVLAKAGHGAEAQASVLETAQQAAERTELLGAELAELRGLVADGMKARHDPRPAPATAGLSNVALVRYDAFTEMSGRLSFSLAMLDERGDGVTISAIAAGTDTRVYAKSVSAGKGEHDLSPEEEQAVAAALAKRRSLRKSA